MVNDAPTNNNYSMCCLFYQFIHFCLPYALVLQFQNQLGPLQVIICSLSDNPPLYLAIIPWSRFYHLHHNSQYQECHFIMFHTLCTMPALVLIFNQNLGPSEVYIFINWTKTASYPRFRRRQAAAGLSTVCSCLANPSALRTIYHQIIKPILNLL